MKTEHFTGQPYRTSTKLVHWQTAIRRRNANMTKLWPRIFAAAVIASVVFVGCRTTGGTNPPPVPLNVVADCTVKSVQEIAKDQLTSVEASLLMDDWKNQLANLVAEFGVDAIACIVDHIIGESRVDVMASADKNARFKVERGEQWLIEHQISVKGGRAERQKKP
jgi:hypothetical protein